MAKMGSIYVAFHELVQQTPPENGVCPHARVVIMASIVAPAVEMAFAEVYDFECEEKTPQERAEDYFMSFMQMDPEMWWEQYINFPDAFVAQHRRLFDRLPAHEPAYPAASAPAEA